MMLRINDPHSIKLIMRAANVNFVPYHHHCIAEYNSLDRLVAGVLFTDWNQGSVLMHLAIFPPAGGLCRQLLWTSFQYAFNQLMVKKVFGLVPEWNIAARNLDLRLGFKIEYKIDDVYNNPPPVDNGMYLMSMKREDCKWLNMKQPPIEYASDERTNRLVAMAQQEGAGATLH